MLAPQSAPAELSPPDYLTGEALAFWERHVEGLASADMLSDQDRDSLALLSIQWEHLRHLDQAIRSDPEDTTKYRLFNDMARQFSQLCKQFAMVPAERRRQAVAYGDNLDSRAPTDEEFQL